MSDIAIFDHGGGLALFFLIAGIGLVLPPFRALWKRSGQSGWWALLMLVPLLNIVALWVLSFKQWPNDPPSGR